MTVETKVQDIMTTRVIWVKADATFREMAVALRENRVSAFPVVDDDHKVIGIASEADMLAKDALSDELGFVGGILHRRDQAKARGVTAGDLMTATVVAVRPEDTVEDAAKGTPETAALDRDLVRKARHVPGVVAVRDRLSYSDDHRIVAGPVV